VLLRILVLLTVAFPALAQPVSGPITYKLDPKKSWVYVVIYNESSVMGFGHDHGIRAMDFTGTVVWDATDLSKCQVDISFPVTVLETDPPGMREREKLALDEAVGENDKRRIRDNFLAASQLDAANHPTISYRSTSCSGTTGNVTVTGDLTIRGQTKAITTTMVVTPTGTSFTAGGAFRARATDFGFQPYTNWVGVGTLRNKDEMKFVIDVVGTPAW